MGRGEGILAGKWRKLHEEELHNLYSKPDTVRMRQKSRMTKTAHGVKEK
jgi:hypothetical protein